ncbi:MAG: alpha/beta hydrolase [Thermodesulfobacteriota bacterium]
MNLIRLPLLLLAVYLTLLLLVYLGQERMIFFPVGSRHGQGRMPPGLTPYDLELKGQAYHGWLVNGEAAGDTLLIYFGGNAEDVFYTAVDFQRLTGVASLFIPYRGYNGNPGAPSQAALLTDALAIHDQAVARLHPERTFAMGRSIGSAVAAYLAREREVAGLIMVTPFDSLTAVARDHYPWLPVSFFLRHPFAVTDFVAALKDTPSLVIRGGSDRIIYPRRTDALLAQLPGPVTVVAIEGAGHNDIQDFPAYWPAITDFLPPDGS